jgi:hypothetical protein
LTQWDFLVAKDDLARTEIRPTALPEMIGAGEVLFEIERFSFTANNITYAVFGDQMGYWQFFPAPEGWGRIPVWGFARVLRSEVEGIDPGLRLYGYWPMSTHFVARMRRDGSDYVDAAAHRAALPSPYNQYFHAPETPHDDVIALLRPLFITSFLIDDLLAEIAPGATAILSSASSRTALGLAWLLARRGTPVVGLTSPGNVAFVQATGLYATVATYDAIGPLALEGPVVFIDFAGDTVARSAVHHLVGDRLLHSATVGVTRHEARGVPSKAPLPGPRPAFFCAPDRFLERAKVVGGQTLNDEAATALLAFADDSPWLHIDHYRGSDELGRLYASVRTGQASSDRGNVALPG